MKIKYKNIAIGEQIYDSVMKHKHATIWKVDERVLLQIEQAVNGVESVLGILSSKQVVGGVFTHTTGVYHGVAVRTLLSANKPVFLGVGGLDALYKYNRVLNEQGHLNIHIKIPVSSFNILFEKNRENLVTEANTYFKKRFGGEINDWDALRAFSPDKKLYQNRKDFFADFPTLDPAKKNVFIMLHAMNDDPHVQVQHLFKDYYHWFSETLKFARTNNAVNWIFKQHPMIKFYPDDANLHGLFDLIKGEGNIVYIDEDVPFNQASVPVVADAIVTCAGTAGLEFSAMGIPAIITAGNSYSGFDICYEPQKLEDYYALLSRIDGLEEVDADKKQRAKVLFYLIYNKLIPGYLTGFLPYMNHDQIKELTSEAALELYEQSFKRDLTPKINNIKKFVEQSSDRESAELFLEI